jgi:hypothetical protein
LQLCRRRLDNWRKACLSHGHAAELLDAAEHVLNGVTIMIDDEKEARLLAPVVLGRDVMRYTRVLSLPADRVDVVPLVAQQNAAGGQALQECDGRLAVCDLSARQQEGDGTAESVRECVDLGRASAPRADDLLSLLSTSADVA